MKTTLRFLPTNLSNHCPPIINLMTKERHDHFLGARQLNSWHIQLVLCLPRFCIYEVYQHQIKNILGKKIPGKLQKTKLEFAMHWARCWIHPNEVMCMNTVAYIEVLHHFIKGPKYLETFVRQCVVVRCPGTNPLRIQRDNHIAHLILKPVRLGTLVTSSRHQH